MVKAYQHNHTTSSIAAGIRQLAANIQGRQDACVDPQNALDKAWTVLLDLDTSSQALPDIQNRQQANRVAVAQACAELSQHHKSADAATLQQLVQEWLSATHYVSRLDALPEAAACSSGSSGHNQNGSQQGFAAVPLSEQHAMLSLLLALRGSCPATKPVLVSLPALGSSFLKGLQQEAQAAVTSSNGGSSWVPMSANPEELIPASTSTFAGTSEAHVSLRACAEVQQNPAASGFSTDFSSWVSPAAAAMQLLQEMPLNAAAHVSTRSAQLLQPAADTGPPDDILIAAACANSTDVPAVAVLPAQHGSAAAQVPPLLQVASHMQRASDRTSLGRPLLLHGSLNARSAGTARSAGHAGAQQQITQANSQGGRISAQSMQQSGHAVSAAAAEAETAIKAAAAVRPWVATLMQLSSATPGSATNGLAWDDGRGSSSDSGSNGSKKDAGGMRESDTGLTKDARPLLLKQQHARVSSGGDVAVSSSSTTSSSGETRQELEAQLVSVACLALQGVWSAVEQLWRLVMHGAQTEHGPANSDRVYRPAAQHHLLVQVLHTAELRLRLSAFLLHYQRPSSSSRTADSTLPSSRTSCDSSSTSNGSAEDSGNRKSDAEAIQVAFVNAVAKSLSELDLSVTTSQVNKLLQQQQKGRPVSLLQLLCVQRDLSRELQQLADVCLCTVEAYVADLSFLKDSPATDICKAAALQARPSSSSSLAWQVLQRAQGARQARAATAALQDAAAAAYAEALPWPGETEAALALQMGWAPSTWQLKRKGIDGGYKLLERLYAGVVRAEGSAPLLRHLFAAAVQPVLQSVHSWAFLPDMQAAEAAAEVTAMASFTAGCVNSSSNPLSSRGTVSGFPCSQGTAAAAGAVAAGGPFASVAQLVGAPPRNSSGGDAGGSSSSKAWTGSKAAETAMRQCLQQAWHSVCARPPGCPQFLAHVQGPAGVAGMQMHLLQLLGGPGQALAERLGWLAEPEQQEIQEVLCSGPSSAAAGDGKIAAAGTGSTSAAAAAAGSFMGLLGGFGPCAGDAHVSAGVGPAGQRPMCDLSTTQLKQCVAITKDYNAAREAEMERLLQELATNRAATRHAHELWLAARQEERQEAEDARSRLEAQAAARRKQRRQLLLAQQKEDIAAAQARRLGTRLQQLSLEQHLLRQSALQERQQALQQLRGELAKLDSVPLAAVADAAAGGVGIEGRDGAVTAGGAATGHGVCAGPFAAAAAAITTVERMSDEAIDLDSVVLDVTAEAAGAAGTAHGAAAVPEGHQLTAEQDAQQSGQQQQRQRGTWGRPLQDIGPAAGAPSGQQTAGPLAVIGSAAAAGTVQAAGRRSNSQPKVLPGMGRPVSASHSRRNSCSDEGGPGLFGAETGPDISAAAAAASVLSAAVGGTGSRMCSVTRGAAASGVSSILGGFGSAFGARAAQQQGPQVKGKWGVPVVPGAAAGVASTLQRRASTGNLTVADVLECTAQQQQQQQQGLQRQPSGGAGGGGSVGWGGPGSRPGTPSRGHRVSENAVYDVMGAGGRQQQPMLQRQQSWHHMQQQQQQLMAQEFVADGAAAVWQPAAAAAGELAAETGAGGDVTAAVVARTGWLQNRHEHRRAEQANPLILDWLAEEIGLQRSIGSSNMMGATSGTEPNAADATAEDVATGQRSAAGARAAAAAAGAAAAAARAAKYGQDDGADISAAATARAAAPMVSALEVLVVQPILAQQRLTTVACWSLLLQEHRLLQRLSAIQGLFFQQQGDWVVLLCDALEPLLVQQQQQQQQRLSQAGGADQAGAGSQQGGMISPVVLQLLLESAVQQSCLARVPEAERMSLTSVSGRALLGWSAASSSSHGSDSADSTAHATAATPAGATDCLLLGYAVPWPVSLLLSDRQLQQYADIFSVLLRLRRLQQRLMKQWQPLNHRASSNAVTAAAPRRRRHASEYGPEPRRNSSNGGAAAAAAGKGARRSTWHGGVPGGLSQGGSRGGSSSAGDGDVLEGTLALSVGLSRLQDLRRWHALALHCVDSLLGYMLGELSGQLQGRFEAAIGARPVELPVMMEAHARLLEEARQVCFLPQQQQQQQGGGGGLAGVTYAIFESAWHLQQQVAELLLQQEQEDKAAAAGVIWISSSSESRVLAKAPSGFKEGTSCSALAAALEGDGEELWESLEVLGQRLERLLDVLKQRLKISAETAAGHPLAGLAARLGV